MLQGKSGKTLPTYSEYRFSENVSKSWPAVLRLFPRVTWAGRRELLAT